MSIHYVILCCEMLSCKYAYNIDGTRCISYFCEYDTICIVSYSWLICCVLQIIKFYFVIINGEDLKMKIKKDRIITIRLTKPQNNEFMAKLNGNNPSTKIRELICSYSPHQIN